MENNDEMSYDTEQGVEFDSNNNSDNIEDESYAAAVKCIFVKPKSIQGAFCVLLRKNDLKLIESVLWTTKSPVEEETSFTLPMPWEDFSTKIPSIGPIDKESRDKLIGVLNEKLTKETIDNIFRMPESYMVAFSNELKELFEKSLHYLIKLDLSFELFNQQRLKNSGYERDDTPSNTTAESVSMSQIISEKANSQVIYCSAIVDPVNGIAVSELQKGDIVEVVFPTNTQMGAILSDYYAKLNRPPEYPVNTVELSENGTYLVELEADGGAACVVKTTSDLRIKARHGSFYASSVSGHGLLIALGVCGVAIIAGLIWLIVRIIG